MVPEYQDKCGLLKFLNSSLYLQLQAEVNI